jgi:hypothetical protein
MTLQIISCGIIGISPDLPCWKNDWFIFTFYDKKQHCDLTTVCKGCQRLNRQGWRRRHLEASQMFMRARWVCWRAELVLQKLWFAFLFWSKFLHSILILCTVAQRGSSPPLAREHTHALARTYARNYVCAHSHTYTPMYAQPAHVQHTHVNAPSYTCTHMYMCAHEHPVWPSGLLNTDIGTVHASWFLIDQSPLFGKSSWLHGGDSALCSGFPRDTRHCHHCPSSGVVLIGFCLPWGYELHVMERAWPWRQGRAWVREPWGQHLSLEPRAHAHFLPSIFPGTFLDSSLLALWKRFNTQSLWDPNVSRL